MKIVLSNITISSQMKRPLKNFHFFIKEDEIIFNGKLHKTI